MSCTIFIPAKARRLDNPVAILTKQSNYQWITREHYLEPRHKQLYVTWPHKVHSNILYWYQVDPGNIDTSITESEAKHLYTLSCCKGVLDSMAFLSGSNNYNKLINVPHAPLYNLYVTPVRRLEAPNEEAASNYERH